MATNAKKKKSKTLTPKTKKAPTKKAPPEKKKPAPKKPAPKVAPKPKKAPAKPAPKKKPAPPPPPAPRKKPAPKPKKAPSKAPKKKPAPPPPAPRKKPSKAPKKAPPPAPKKPAPKPKKAPSKAPKKKPTPPPPAPKKKPSKAPKKPAKPTPPPAPKKAPKKKPTPPPAPPPPAPPAPPPKAPVKLPPMPPPPPPAELSVLGQLAFPGWQEALAEAAGASGGTEQTYLYPSGEIDGIIWGQLASGSEEELEAFLLSLGDVLDPYVASAIDRQNAYWAYRLTYLWIEDISADYLDMQTGEDVRYAVVSYGGAVAKVGEGEDTLVHRIPIVTGWHHVYPALAAKTAQQLDQKTRDNHAEEGWLLESAELIFFYSPSGKRPGKKDERPV